MARRIVFHDPSLDEQLRAGSLDAVKMIRGRDKDRSMRGDYSFATKYAHWHHPEVYPIYDSKAVAALAKLAPDTPDVPHLKDVNAYIACFEDYAAFKAVVDGCRRVWTPTWTYKQFDKALFVLGRRITSRQQQRE